MKLLGEIKDKGMLKLTNSQIDVLHELAATKIASGQRRGQAYSNALFDMSQNHPDLQEIYRRVTGGMIQGTNMDPYYKDENLNRFFEEIC